MKTKPKPILQPIAGFFRQLQQRTSVALMASIVSVCALGVSWYQVQLSRQQQLASVWPYLSISGNGTANEKEQAWGIKVTNNGLGPAIIERVELRLDGKTLPSDVFMETLRTENTKTDSLLRLDFTSNDIGSGSVYAAGFTEDWVKFLQVFEGRPPSKTASSVYLPRVSLSIYYKSLYDEHWLSCFNCPGTGLDEVRKLD
ncbi:MAG: hypothetical protein IT258_19110 [Saprospiraceae bacterium]|nr:hypothetical protein [Saprospiraceae bacterium]